MMKEMKVLNKASCCPSRTSAQKQNVFAPRPFAPKVEEREAPMGGSRIDFSFADIDLLPRKTVQPKLVLGPVGDKYEQEADRVARRVVETISSPDQESVQRQEDLEDEDELDLEEALEEEEELRRKVVVSSASGGADVGPSLESEIQGARGRGQPLSDSVRQPMERAFGADFGRVRVHADAEADSLNRSLQARAFTTGQDIFLRQGEYRPGNFEGQRLLAHELTHVVQQTGSCVLVQRRLWDNFPAKFQTENNEDAANSEYDVTITGYRRYAPINIKRGILDQVYFESDNRSFLYLTGMPEDLNTVEYDALFESPKVQSVDGYTVTLTSGKPKYTSSPPVVASAYPTEGALVYDCTVINDETGQVAPDDSHVGHKVTALGRTLPTLDDPDMLQAALRRLRNRTQD